MLSDQLDALVMAVGGETLQEAMAFAGSVGTGKFRNNREGGQPRKGFDVVRGLHGIVEILAHQSQADTADQTNEKSEGNVAGLGGTRGRGRNHGGIHDADVGRAQSGGNRGFLQFGHQTFVESLVGLGFALENVIFHKLSCHLVGFRLLLVERISEERFALLRFVVITLEDVQDFLFFFFDGLIKFFELRLEALYLGEIGAILGQGVGVLRGGVAALLEQIADGGVVLNLRYSVEIASLGELIERFLFHAFALRVGQLLVNVGKPLGSDVLLVVKRPNLILAFVGDAGIFGSLHLDLQLTELVREPRGSMGSSLVLAAEILLDVGGDVGVDDARRELGIGGFKTDIHQTAIGNAPNAKTSQKLS